MSLDAQIATRSLLPQEMIEGVSTGFFPYLKMFVIKIVLLGIEEL